MLFWEGLFSGALLVSGRLSPCVCWGESFVSERVHLENWCISPISRVVNLQCWFFSVTFSQRCLSTSRIHANHADPRTNYNKTCPPKELSHRNDLSHLVGDFTINTDKRRYTGMISVYINRPYLFEDSSGAICKI